MATQVQILTGALLQIEKSALRSQDAEGTLRKIRQLANLALRKCSPADKKTSVGDGENLAREAAKEIAAEDVDAAAQEIADQAKVEQVASAKIDKEKPDAGRQDGPVGDAPRP